MNSKRILPYLMRKYQSDLALNGEFSDACRAILLAHIRSSTFAAKFVGMYISGKMAIIDHNGEVLDETWQKYLNEILTTPDESLQISLNRIHRKVGQMKDFGDGLPSKLIIYCENKVLKSKLEDILNQLDCEMFFYEEIFYAQFTFFVKNCNLKNTFLNLKDYLSYLKELINYLKKENIVKYSPIKTKNNIINKVIEELNLEFKNDDTVYCEILEENIKYFLKGNLVDSSSLTAKLVTFLYKKCKNIGVVLPPYTNISLLKYLENICKIVNKTDEFSLKDYKDSFDILIYVDHNNLITIHSKVKELDLLNCNGDPLVSYFIFEHLIDFYSVIYEELPNRFIEINIKNKIENIKFTKVDEMLKINKCTGKIRTHEKKVKIYVEGRNQRQVDECAVEIAQYLYDNCDGVGYHPEINYQ